MTLPLDGVPLRAVPDLAREIEDLGYSGIWTAEGTGPEGFTPLAAAAAVTRGIRLGIAVAPVFTRGPVLLAQTASTLASLAPGRFTLGIGSGSDIIVGRLNDIAFERPFSRTRDMLRFLRAALSGERVEQSYDTFRVGGYRCETVPPEPVPILVAGLRSRMLELGGTEGDGAILTLVSAEDAARMVPFVRGTDGARSGKEVAARVLVAPTEDADRARAAGRRLLAAYLNVPVYREFYRWLGHDELERTWKLWAAGERRQALEAVPDDIVDALVVHGAPARMREHLQRFVEAGVGTPTAMLLDVGTDHRRALRDLAPR
ncbi:LLM class F420-dependent oxidoreductase [Nocardioides sp. LHD-245]|uniref:LLM class F420-dependent oxidoreductase n=1 Tax=Nocardioides sp. LHD-245 TaxID=3051387 RepID=UPI0027DFDABC|nr:LLM class F420-dependent oxidoreductase [Nocardioides sp. LHD-245]